MYLLPLSLSLANYHVTTGACQQIICSTVDLCEDRPVQIVRFSIFGFSICTAERGLQMSNRSSVESAEFSSTTNAHSLLSESIVLTARFRFTNKIPYANVSANVHWLIRNKMHWVTRVLLALQTVRLNALFGNSISEAKFDYTTIRNVTALWQGIRVVWVAGSRPSVRGVIGFLIKWTTQRFHMKLTIEFY